MCVFYYKKQENVLLNQIYHFKVNIFAVHILITNFGSFFLENFCHSKVRFDYEVFGHFRVVDD